MAYLVLTLLSFGYCFQIWNCKASIPQAMLALTYSFFLSLFAVPVAFHSGSILPLTSGAVLSLLSFPLIHK